MPAERRAILVHQGKGKEGRERREGKLVRVVGGNDRASSVFQEEGTT